MIGVFVVDRLHVTDYERRTLENGLRIVWLPLPHAHSISIQAFVRSGSAFETRATSGASHLLEHLHLSTTHRFPTRRQLKQAIAEIAGHFDAETTADYLHFTLGVAPDRLDAALELLREIIEPRPYSDDVFQSEKQLLSTELASAPDGQMSLREAIFGKHPFSLPVGGSAKSVLRLRAQDIHEFDRRSFRPDRVVLAIAGAITPNDIERAHSIFRTWRSSESEPLRPPTPPTSTFPIIRAKVGFGRLKSITLGFVLPDLETHADRVMFMLLLSYLNAFSSRFHDEVRYGAGSTYAFGSEAYEVCQTRLLYTFGTTRGRDRDAFIDLVLKQYIDIRDGHGDDATFAIARQNYRYAVRRAWDIPDAVTFRIGVLELDEDLGPLSISQELTIIEKLGPGDLAAFAHRVCVRNRLFLLFDMKSFSLDATAVKRLIKKRL